MEARGDEPGALGVFAEQSPAQPAAIEWFASVDGSPVGPLSTEELVSRISTGVLDWDAHLWREGYPAWKTVGDSDTIVRAVASSRGSMDENARADSTERTMTPQDPADDDAPTTATLDEAPTIATLEDSPTRVAYDETPTRMFSASAPPSAGLQPVARTSFASRPPSVTGSRPPGELAAVRAGKPASFVPGVLPAANTAAAQSYMSEPHPAPIALPYEPPLQHSFTANAQPLPIHGRSPASIVPGAGGYAGGEGSGLIDIRALASLAQSQARQQPRPQPTYAEPRAYERMPAMQQSQAAEAHAYAEAENGQGDPLASFGANHGVAFAALDSLAPTSREKKPKDATVPLAILTGASMIAAAAFAALYITRATPAGSAPLGSVAQPAAAAAPVAAPVEPVAAAAPIEEADKAEVAAPSAPVEAAAAPPEPEKPEAAVAAPAEAEEAAAPRASKRGAAPRKPQRVARAQAEPAEEEEPAAQAKAEEKPPSVDDILLGNDDKKPAAEPAPTAPPAKAKAEASASRSIDDLLDGAVTDKKAAAPAASALPESPSRNDVLAAMRGIESEVRACAANEPIEGTANVAITVIGSSGKVTSADVTGIQGAVGSCIARAARKASFSPFSKDRFSVSYPYRFKAGS